MRHANMRVLIALTVSAAVFASAATSVAADNTVGRVQPTQLLATLSTSKIVHLAPSPSSPQIRTLPATAPITEMPTTVPVARVRKSNGLQWLEVLLPGRPNSSVGWITRRNTTETITKWHLTVTLARREVTAYYNGKKVKSFQAVVGKPSTPTPTGQFFVEESVQMPAGAAGGPFALALSARSNALQEFEGGPGQIGIHGRDNLGGVLGAAESHGCIRLATSSIDWLEQRIEPGTPVTISQS